ncbi:MAG: PfkB family carbohydrate kinase [Pseudomonadota bacterium]
MTGAGIFVLGALHYDILVDVPHLPVRDETVMGGGIGFACGGKGGNQAMAASRHGAEVWFAGMVGEDDFGASMLETLASAGVDVSQVQRTGDAISGTSVAMVEAGGEYGAVVASGANRLIDVDRITLPEGAGYLVLQNELPEAVNLAVARKAGAKVVWNAAPWRGFQPEMLGLVDLLIVNRVEAEGLFGRALQSTEETMAVLRESELPIDQVVVTRGADGLVFCERGQAPRHVPAITVEPQSSHGAGDSFVGALCAELAGGSPFQEALAYANAAAALHVGTAPGNRASITRQDVLSLL